MIAERMVNFCHGVIRREIRYSSHGNGYGAVEISMILKRKSFSARTFRTVQNLMPGGPMADNTVGWHFDTIFHVSQVQTGAYFLQCI